MKKATFLAVLVFALTALFSVASQAQEKDVPSKVEVGIQFSSLTTNGPSPFPSVFPGRSITEAGFGGRFTFNFSKHIALEAEGNFFPHNNFSEIERSGRIAQGQFGIKAGKRFGKFGIFAKARPGLISFSRTLSPSDDLPPFLEPRRNTHFSMDLGGVVEFYPSRSLLTRIDIGDTMIHYGSDSFFPFDPSFPPTSRTTHNLQVSAGIGFRFGSLQPEETATQAHDEQQKRFEVGVQFSSLSLRQVEHFPSSLFTFPDFTDTITQAGFGGRFAFNLTPNFALEVQGDFYPQENPQSFFNNGRAGGRILQGQAGVKAGKRFEKFGIFAKARPGVVSFSRTFEFDGFDPTFGFPILRVERNTYFSMDLGGVLEFYPRRHIVTRFDGGDTMIRFGANPAFGTGFPQSPSPQVRAETTHNFQFSAGVGYRF